MGSTRRAFYRAAAALVVAIASVLALAACGDRDQGQGQVFKFTSATKTGMTIPTANRKPINTVTGTLMSGEKYSLATERGSVVLVNFWAAWCADCRVETPQLDLLYRQVKADGIDFLGVDTKEVNRHAGTSFLTDNNISYPSLWDEQGKIALELGDVPTSGLPFTVLIDKQQRVAAIYLGILTPADLQPVLTSLAAEPA